MWYQTVAIHSSITWNTEQMTSRYDPSSNKNHNYGFVFNLKMQPNKNERKRTDNLIFLIAQVD